MKKNKTVRYCDLGLQPYAETWDLQERLLSSICDVKLANRSRSASEFVPTKHYLLFCSHPPTYTLGKSGDMGHLLGNEAFLKQIGASFFKINRGGDITFHGPGQLVAYPILDLDAFFTDIHRYLRCLEEAVIRVCGDLGLLASRKEGLTGVWLDADRPHARKICAMGVKASRWVTMHGLALNVNTDLSYFQHIVPCGISEYGVTSLAQELGQVQDENHIKRLLLGHLQAIFEMEIKHVSRETLTEDNEEL